MTVTQNNALFGNDKVTITWNAMYVGSGCAFTGSLYASTQGKSNGSHLVCGAPSFVRDGRATGRVHFLRLDPRPNHPGSGEDLVLETGGREPADGRNTRLVAEGEPVPVAVRSPAGTFDHGLVVLLFDVKARTLPWLRARSSRKYGSICHARSPSRSSCRPGASS